VKITLFSVEQANQMVNEIRPLVKRLVEVKAEFDRIQSQVDVLSLVAAGAAPSNPDAQQLQALHLRRSTLGNELTRGVQTVQRRGCVVKDVDKGLVDFYTLSGDRLVFLCWQLGEAEIAHWHTLEGGFSGRQPLNRSELE
jgi:hypothetical protein